MSKHVQKNNYGYTCIRNSEKVDTFTLSGGSRSRKDRTGVTEDTKARISTSTVRRSFIFLNTKY